MEMQRELNSNMTKNTRLFTLYPVIVIDVVQAHNTDNNEVSHWYLHVPKSAGDYSPPISYDGFALVLVGW